MYKETTPLARSRTSFVITLRGRGSTREVQVLSLDRPCVQEQQWIPSITSLKETKFIICLICDTLASSTFFSELPFIPTKGKFRSRGYSRRVEIVSAQSNIPNRDIHVIDHAISTLNAPLFFLSHRIRKYSDIHLCCRILQ